MQPITTKYGELIPQHTADDLRKKEILPVEYHGSGTPKSVPLETQTVIPTPAGDIPAELVSFHKNGTINRVFPLNGKLSGYWSEADEMELARPVKLLTPVGAITACIISISFYDDETLRSITFCPGETVAIATPTGFYETRIGVSFYPDGAVQSLEPARPIPVKTMAGEIMAYDPDAIGVNGDKNSLIFDNKGNVVQATTTLSQIKVVKSSGETTHFAPEYRDSYCGDSEQEIIPMIVGFQEQTVCISTKPEAPATEIPKTDHAFYSGAHIPQLMHGVAAL